MKLNLLTIRYNQQYNGGAPQGITRQYVDAFVITRIALLNFFDMPPLNIMVNEFSKN